MTTASLDHLANIAALDPNNMIGAVLAFPELAERAREITLESGLGEAPVIRNIVVSGLGTSALAADLARAVLRDQLRVPFIVNREYSVPEFVDETTLFVASSYSGTTEETVAAFTRAQERGAQIIVMTTGGPLAARARAGGYPVVHVPAGFPARAALAFGLLPLIYAFVHYGLIPDPGHSFEEMLAVTRSIRDRCKPEIPTDANVAKSLARQVCGHIPVIYGSEGYRGVIAQRWKSQFNENAKMFAAAGVFPEVHHNETLAWSGPGELESKLFALILRDPKEPQPIVQRVELTKAIIAKRAAGVVDIWSEGAGDLAKVCSLAYLGDFISLYLAYLGRQDPSSGAAVDWPKAELTKA